MMNHNTSDIMTENRIRPINDVLIEIYEDGKKVDTYQGSGYHTLDEAVQTAYEASDRTHLPIEDYAFRVTNLENKTAARYRINAGGNLKILPE